MADYLMYNSIKRFIFPHLLNLKTFSFKLKFPMRNIVEKPLRYSHSLYIYS